MITRQRNSPLETMNNQGGKAAKIERENSPENNLKEIEIYSLNDREIRVVPKKKKTQKKTKWKINLIDNSKNLEAK